MEFRTRICKTAKYLTAIALSLASPVLAQGPHSTFTLKELTVESAKIIGRIHVNGKGHVA